MVNRHTNKRHTPLHSSGIGRREQHGCMTGRGGGITEQVSIFKWNWRAEEAHDHRTEQGLLSIMSFYRKYV